ncbi:RDD family protein [Kribbella shirazensis]|uniref:Putative RDD family membrane protein YckC n=1 Tax=Kribbella shirazensis TaxID=1105143 RepID=A0A7X5V5W2_9ACTN|nr:putative RDD family membrane protein YckC [Kribbella shirazensis]
MSSQAAGWYDDPEDPSQQRYWDGNAWTDQRRPQQGPPPFQGQFGQPRPADAPRYGQSAQHGQVFGGAQPSQPQYGQQGQPQYGQQQPQHGQQGQPQYGQNQPQYGQQSQPQYGQPGPPQYGQRIEPEPPQYGQRVPQQGGYQPYPQGGYQPHPQAGQGFGYPGQRLNTTPDGRQLSGWWRRVFAKIIDSIIVWIIGLPLTGYFYYQYSQSLVDYFVDTMRAAEAGTPASTATLPPEVYKWMIPATLIGFAVSFAYEYLFLTKKGATPGKMALNIRVHYVPAVLTHGTEIPATPPGSAVAKRYGLQILFSVAGLIPLVGTLASFGALLDYLWPLWDDKNQALHDKVASTYVIRT